jgi:FixJ family two-component response regulator
MLQVEKRMKTLISIVDDDPSVREGLVDLLRSMGFVAEAFERAIDFLNSDRLHSTSCLIADVQMPGMTGLELNDRLIASGNFIPTILITAVPNARDMTRAQRAGAICYLTKPFAELQLLYCIGEALETKGKDS